MVRLFGSTFVETYEALYGSGGAHLGAEPAGIPESRGAAGAESGGSEEGTRPPERIGSPAPSDPSEAPSDGTEKVKAIGRLLISLLLVGAGTFLVVWNDGQASQLGSTMLGTVLGYWLK